MSDEPPDDDGQDDATITIEVRREMMENSRYSVLVRRYRLGQLRIQLCDAALPDADAPALHGAVVRELWTNQWRTMLGVLLQLRGSQDPPALCRTLETAANCERPGLGLIQLDIDPDDLPRRP